MEEEYDDYNDDGGLDDDGNPAFECGIDSDGLCSLAGTEDCDFECPNRSELMKREKAQ